MSRSLTSRMIYRVPGNLPNIKKDHGAYGLPASALQVIGVEHTHLLECSTLRTRQVESSRAEHLHIHIPIDP